MANKVHHFKFKQRNFAELAFFFFWPLISRTTWITFVIDHSLQEIYFAMTNGHANALKIIHIMWLNPSMAATLKCWNHDVLHERKMNHTSNYLSVMILSQLSRTTYEQPHNSTLLSPIHIIHCSYSSTMCMMLPQAMFIETNQKRGMATQ